MVRQRILLQSVFGIALVILIMCLTDIFMPQTHYFESNTTVSFDIRQLENISIHDTIIFKTTPSLWPRIAEDMFGLRNFTYQLQKNTTLNYSRRESLLSYNCSMGWNSHCLKNPTPILTIPTSACKTNKRNLLLLMIFSQPMDIERRQHIRATWGKVAHESGSIAVSHVFLLGILGEEDEAARQEAKKYGDILLGDFRDTYLNLTLKTIMGYNWFSSNCTNVDFLMKTDDDVYINTAALVTALQRKQRKTQKWQMEMFGYCLGYNPVSRDLGKKWSMPLDEFPDTLYPYYCSGTGYVIGGTAARKVAAVLKWIPVFRVEDAYIGVALTRLEDKVTVTHMPKYFHRKYDGSICAALRMGQVYVVSRVSVKEMALFNKRCWYSTYDTFNYYWYRVTGCVSVYGHHRWCNSLPPGNSSAPTPIPGPVTWEWEFINFEGCKSQIGWSHVHLIFITGNTQIPGKKSYIEGVMYIEISFDISSQVSKDIPYL